MLTTTSRLKGVTVAAIDGDIGSVQDLYFDDRHWTIRYLMVDTGTWLPGKQVLLSPLSVGELTPGDHLTVKLTRDQVEQSPPIETDKPVDRQHETAFSTYYGYPFYWEGAYRWGLTDFPGLTPIPVGPAPGPVDEEMLARERGRADPHLRSARDVTGYYIEATDGDLGHVEDFLVEDATWAIRYMIVDTRNWWPGRKVLVSPAWISGVSWTDSKVRVDLSRAQIESAPQYDPSQPLAREHEERLYEHLDRRRYW
jgi:hypothetical protein